MTYWVEPLAFFTGSNGHLPSTVRLSPGRGSSPRLKSVRASACRQITPLPASCSGRSNRSRVHCCKFHPRNEASSERSTCLNGKLLLTCEKLFSQKGSPLTSMPERPWARLFTPPRLVTIGNFCVEFLSFFGDFSDQLKLYCFIFNNDVLNESFFANFDSQTRTFSIDPNRVCESGF